MCELLGLSFNKPVQARFSIGRLWKKAEGPHGNPDGWGLGYYPLRKDQRRSELAQIVKAPEKATDSYLAKAFAKQVPVRSSVFICHIRRATKGIVAYPNTHPFYQAHAGREYIFAHNGHLTGGPDIPDRSPFRPTGTTDSERAFCHLMSRVKTRLERKGRKKIIREDFGWVKKTFDEISEFGKFNCLFSDGARLYCYQHRRFKPGPLHLGLYYVARKPPYRDDFFDVVLNKRAGEKGIVVASSPYSSGREDWAELGERRMLVLENGRPSLIV
jgi:glutamine amidotransferase